MIGALQLRLGDRRFDIRRRPIVMGILNRTADSFYDRGAYLRPNAFFRRAEQLTAEGADVLEVGARAAGVGTREVGEQEEIDIVASSVDELTARFEVPVAVDTWRSSVARAAFAAGAVLGNDISGFSDASYLQAAADAGAAVVATHMRLAPRVADPNPVYVDVVKDVAAALGSMADAAVDEGIPRESVIVDPGLDLGKTWEQSLELLAAMDTFAALGHPVMVAASNKIFLGRALDLEKHERVNVTVAACTFAACRGARVFRVHEVRPAREAADLLQHVLCDG